ncbi:FadR/GntR family transcriptional regulator [Leptospira idonii]|uniref:FadR family transcriptional regulator n=1 Tax=Leptospira idonii TaxID=1193500 RepID=A0A4R9LYK9_9LEPT|nr:GntR family transcriptional regulator [Leptospira idonii]TGN17060.1 FadR family transcriptional regulator [Leptospira idonii]
MLPHKLVVKKFIRDVYEEKLKPGDKLPPLRELSKQLNTDQTSLRIALKHLEFMKILEIKRSDGVYVLDYRKNAGPEFLMELFPESEEDNSHINSYLIDEAFEYWIVLVPELIRLAWKRYSIRNIREMLNIYEEEAKNLNNISVLVELEMRHINLLTEVTNNIMVTLTMNSILPLRKKMTEFFIKAIGKDEFAKYISLRKKLARGYLTENHADRETSIQTYRDAMDRYRKMMRDQIAKGLK